MHSNIIDIIKFPAIFMKEMKEKLKWKMYMYRGDVCFPIFCRCELK